MRRKTNVGQLMLIAQDCIQKSQYNNAIKILSQVTELENKNDEAYRLLGDCFDQLGEREEAEKNYKIGIDCNPLSILCYANYGLLLYNMGRKGEAEKLYQLSMEINPRDPTVLNNYMVLLFQMGKFDKAEEISKLCQQVDPGNPNCKMYLNKISTSRIREEKKVTRPGPGKGHSNQEQLLELLWQRDQIISQKDNSISDLKLQLLARQKQIKDLQTQIQKLQKKRTEDENTRSCKICLNNTAMYLNKKCGHLSACKGCLAIVGKNCPLCRETGSFIRVYSSLIREDLY